MSGGGGGGGGSRESAEARELYKAQADISREMWGLFKTHGLPQLTRLAEQVNEYESPGRIAQAEGMAATDVGQAYDTAESGMRNEMGRYGVRPGSGKFMAGMRNLALGRAADTAGAKTTARVGILDRALQNRFGLASVWQGQAGQAIGGLGQAASGLANIGHSMRQARAQRSAGMWSGIGSLAGSLGAAWILSDPRVKRDIEPIGELRNGLIVYEFSYIDDPYTVYAGLMADEVFTVMPHHVGARGGYLTIAPFAILEELAGYELGRA